MPRLNIFTNEEIKAFDKPPKLSPTQRAEYFYLSESVIKTLGKMRSATYKIALVLHNGYFKASGRFFKSIYFRASDIRHVSQQMGLDPDSFDHNAYTSNTKIHQRHINTVLNINGFQKFGHNAKGVLKEILEQLAISHADPKTIDQFIAG